MSLLDLSMDDLPQQVMVDILSRLPVKTIIHCKCVCKMWLNIILDTYFANLYLSRSPASIIHHYPQRQVMDPTPGILKWIDVEDDLGGQQLYHDPVMSIDLNVSPVFQNGEILKVGLVNGLVCLWQFGEGKDNTYICNLITREYMILPSQQYHIEGNNEHIVYGFGVSSLSHEYKVIRIVQGVKTQDSTSKSRPSLLQAEVYTLGTGQWRSLCNVPYWLKDYHGQFLNGHAHWIVLDEDSPEKLYAFDFEKETFELFPSPPSDAADIGESIEECLGIIKGCLCRCDSYCTQFTTFTVWMMKEYGIKKSWHKELVIKQNISNDFELPFLEHQYGVEGFKDGTVLTGSYEDALFFYCPRGKVLDSETYECYFIGFSYRPSFHRLQNFKNERVHVF